MSVKFNPRTFEALFVRTLDELSEFFKATLENIGVLVTDLPTILASATSGYVS